MAFIHFNGELIPADEKLVGAHNRGLRYGDGLFETIKVVNGKIPLETFHFDRLLAGLKTLQFELPAFFTRTYFSEAILTLCQKNNLEPLARVRLNIFRGNGTVYSLTERNPFIVIEAEPMPEDYSSFNEIGLAIDIYKEVKKSCDILSNIKSNNFLPYIMAANYAKDLHVDDCLLLNSYDRICDSTIANVFWVKNKKVFTPPLSEGCVSGVMRKYLLEKMRDAGYAVEERICPRQKLVEADEVFLTNALFGICWVEKLDETIYTNKISSQLYKQFIKILC